MIDLDYLIGINEYVCNLANENSVVINKDNLIDKEVPYLIGHGWSDKFM